MKKKLVSIIVCAAISVVSLAGCGSAASAANEKGNSSENTGTETKAEDAVSNLIAATKTPVELTLWCSETQEYQSVMAELVDEFKKKYPEVDFNITIGSESEAECKNDVLSDVEEAADVFIFPDDQLPDLVKAGALQKIEATYTYDPKQTNAPQIVEAASENGDLYAYPLTASNGYFLFYDKTKLSEEDVKSWDSLLEAAEKQGKTVGMEVSGAWFLYGFFAGAGLDMKAGDDGKNICNWNATDTKYKGSDVASAITEICKNPAMKNCVNEDAQSFALNGQMIADVNGAWAINAFKKAYGDGYAAAKLPTFTVNGEQVQMGSFAGYKFVGVNAYSKNPGWAMLLSEFITDKTSQEKISLATGEAPANTEAAESSEISSEPALEALAEQAKYSSLQRVGDNYWEPAASLGQSLVEGKYSDVQKLLDGAVAGITQ